MHDAEKKIILAFLIWQVSALNPKIHLCVMLNEENLTNYLTESFRIEAP